MLLNSLDWKNTGISFIFLTVNLWHKSTMKELHLYYPLVFTNKQSFRPALKISLFVCCLLTFQAGSIGRKIIFFWLTVIEKHILFK